MVVTIKMTSGDVVEIQLEKSPSNRKKELARIKEAMTKRTLLDYGNDACLNGKYIESFSVQSFDED